MKLRQLEGGDLAHWCPGCLQMHVLPIVRGGWTFNGDHERPTCTPSFKHRWTLSGAEKVCHYILTDGVLFFCPDSTHPLAGQTAVLPELAPIGPCARCEVAAAESRVTIECDGGVKVNTQLCVPCRQHVFAELDRVGAIFEQYRAQGMSVELAGRATMRWHNTGG